MMRGLKLVMVAGGGASGHCWCRSSRTCRFNRCENCDQPVDRDGRALLDDFGASNIDWHAGPCPYCNGPMPKP